MSRITNIITNVRDILHDEGSDRYTDDYLIRLLNNAIDDFNMNTEYLKTYGFLEIIQDINTYTVPNCIKINRINYIDKMVEQRTEEQMDRLDSTWQYTKGSDVKYVILDKMPVGQFMIYPTITSEAANIITQNSPYGGLIDIEYIYDILGLLSIGDVESIPKFMKIFYVKDHPDVTITTLDADFLLPEIYDSAMEFYVSGMALRHDRDDQNRAFGAEQLNLYQGYVRKASSKDSENNNKIPGAGASYKGFI